MARRGSEWAGTAPAADEWAGRPGPGPAWAAVGVLLILYGLAFIDRQVIALLVKPIKHDLGINDFQISLLQGFSFALLYSICGLPLGFAADRLPRRWVIFGGVIIWALAASACGLAQTFPQLLAARFLVGMGEAALAPAAYSILSDLFPRKRLTFALSVYSIGALIGSGASLGMGALVVLWAAHGVTVPLLGHLSVWQAAFLATGLPGIPIAFLVFIIPEPARGAGKAGDGGSWRDLFAFIATRRGYFACHVIGFASVMAMAYANLAWTPTFLNRTFGWPIPKVGLILAGFSVVTGSISFLFSGRMVDMLQRRGVTDAHFRFYLWATAALAVSAGLAFVAPSPLLFFALIAIGAVAMNMAAIGASAIQLVTPAPLRGRVSALYLMIAGLLAMTLGPSTVGFITDYVLHDEKRIGLALSLTFLTFSPIALIAFWLGLKPMRRAVELAGEGA
ncbi:MAG: transporter [Caulobacter sp.]|nr:transporter [Caulobacter sp.]